MARALIEYSQGAGLPQAELITRMKDDAVGGRAVEERAHTTVHADASVPRDADQS